MVDDPFGQHPTGIPEALPNLPGFAVLEILDDHEQHEWECIPLGGRGGSSKSARLDRTAGQVRAFCDVEMLGGVVALGY